MEEEKYYYSKYIKYKKKYLQIAGNYKNTDNILDTNRCIEDETGIFSNLSECLNNNIWKDNYIELYNNLLNVLSKNEPIVQNSPIMIRIDSLLTLLIGNLNKIYAFASQSDKRIINYNMRFIVNIVSMIMDKDKKFSSSLDNNVEFNKSQPLDKEKNFYYIEDAYVDDIHLFFSEYDKLISEKKSIFFYRSNLVNISILLKCFSDRCIEKISRIKKTFYTEMYDQISENEFNTIFENFQTCKIKMLKSLLEAYTDFAYEKIKKVYINYIKFHYDNVIQLNVISSNDDKRANIDNSYEIINKRIEESGTIYFIYLSCNLPSEIKFLRFEMTRILTSYIGHKENSDNFYNSLSMVSHDFETPHEQYNRKISYTEDELLQLRKFLYLLYESFGSNKILFSQIINFIHIRNYDTLVSKLTIERLIDQNTDSLIIMHHYVINIIEKYINKYKSLNPVLKKENIIKLLDDNNIITRLFGNKKILNKKNLSILNEDEKNLIIESLKTVMETESINKIDILLNEIKIFMNNSTYKINLKEILTLSQIIFLKFYIKSNFEDREMHYIFIKFLYKNYPSLFDNIVRDNLILLENEDI